MIFCPVILTCFLLHHPHFFIQLLRWAEVPLGHSNCIVNASTTVFFQYIRQFYPIVWRLWFIIAGVFIFNDDLINLNDLSCINSFFLLFFFLPLLEIFFFFFLCQNIEFSISFALSHLLNDFLSWLLLSIEWYLDNIVTELWCFYNLNWNILFNDLNKHWWTLLSLGNWWSWFWGPSCYLSCFFPLFYLQQLFSFRWSCTSRCLGFIAWWFKLFNFITFIFNLSFKFFYF